MLAMSYPAYNLELAYLKQYKLISGVDEAGRGPLAGPVVAAAVILNPDNIGIRRSKNKWWHDLRDSKLMTGQARLRLLDQIKANALSFGIGAVAPDKIDELNIHQASLLAMRLAINHCQPEPDCVLIDGLFTIKDLTLKQKAIVNGDQKILSIAAASVLAKVYRDNLMTEFHRQYPQYGFDQHKGYATAQHRTMLAKYGPCPIHRKSFVKTIDG